MYLMQFRIARKNWPQRTRAPCSYMEAGKANLLLVLFEWFLQSHNLSLSFCLYSFIVYSVDVRREQMLPSAYPKSNTEGYLINFLRYLQFIPLIKWNYPE
jgi:hypothetical protein